MKDTDEIRLVLSKRQLKAALFLALIAGGAYFLFSESFTISTTYPSPSGVYNQMITTGNTYLARNAGAMVGVATTAPTQTLDVNGGALVSGTVTAGLFSGSGASLTSLPWAGLTGFPAACPAGQYATAVGGALTCAAPAGAGAPAWNTITGFPAGCPSGKFVTAVGGTLTCASPGAAALGSAIYYCSGCGSGSGFSLSSQCYEHGYINCSLLGYLVQQ